LRQVLLLNSSYEPLNICSWKRAVVLVLKGKAETVERNGKMLHTGEGAETPLPLVIRLLYYVKIPHKDIPLTRRNIMHRDKYSCQYCGKKSELTIDHVLPRSRGGKDTWDNVVAACLRCNISKSNRTPKEADMPLRNKPCRPSYFIHFEVSKHHHSNKIDFEQWKKYMFGYAGEEEPQAS